MCNRRREGRVRVWLLIWWLCMLRGFENTSFHLNSKLHQMVNMKNIFLNKKFKLSPVVAEKNVILHCYFMSNCQMLEMKSNFFLNGKGMIFSSCWRQCDIMLLFNDFVNLAFLYLKHCRKYQYFLNSKFTFFNWTIISMY